MKIVVFGAEFFLRDNLVLACCTLFYLTLACFSFVKSTSSFAWPMEDKSEDGFGFMKNGGEIDV